MKMSQHAMIRARQRGIPRDVIRLITEYGMPVRRKGNALEYSIGKKKFANELHNCGMILMFCKRLTVKQCW